MPAENPREVGAVWIPAESPGFPYGNLGEAEKVFRLLNAEGSDHLSGRHSGLGKEFLMKKSTAQPTLRDQFIHAQRL